MKKNNSSSKCDVYEGKVTSVLGKKYIVNVNHFFWTCHIRGRLFLNKKAIKPVVGDKVLVEKNLNDGEEGVIFKIFDRKSFLSRALVKSRSEQIIASNIDFVFICLSANEPSFKPFLVDRYIVACEYFSLDFILLINKIDLVDSSYLSKIKGEFEHLGYHILCTSTFSNTGIEELYRMCQNRCSVFTGPSGVGKSSLLNILYPELTLPIGSVNSFTGKGRHTTTVSTLFPINNGFIMDTPGIREFSVSRIKRQNLSFFFKEFINYVSFCRFRNCSHISEPGCAIKDAVEDNLISLRRYKSYVKIFKEIDHNLT